MDYETWLEAKNIDIRTLEPEMQTCLRERYEWYLEAKQRPPSKALVVPIDNCQWPQRGFWVPTMNAI
jgi:hypothetical protein